MSSRSSLPRVNDISGWRRTLGVFGLSTVLALSSTPAIALASETTETTDDAGELQFVAVEPLNDEDELSVDVVDGEDSSSDASLADVWNADSIMTPDDEMHRDGALSGGSDDPDENDSEVEAQDPERGAQLQNQANSTLTANEEKPHGVYQDVMEWEVDVTSNTVYITCDGAIPFGNAPWWGSVNTELPINLVFNEGVTSIPANFCGNRGAGSYGTITIPSTMQSIGSGAFRCMIDQYTPQEIVVPESGSPLFDGTFLYSDASKTSIVTVPQNANVSAAIEIPETVTAIYDASFDGVTTDHLSLPASVKTIGYQAFSHATIYSVELDSGNDGGFYIDNDSSSKTYGSVLESGYGNVVVPVVYSANVDEYGVVYSEDGKRLIRVPENLGPSYVVRDGCEFISNNAFSSCTKLEDVSVPDSVSDFGTAFQGCASLKSVSFPSNLTAIPAQAFQGCIGLSEINLPNTVTVIGNNAFDGCTSLESVTLSPALSDMGNYAFRDCASLTQVVMPNGMTDIGDRAFQGCSSLKLVVIPDTVTTIGVGAFEGTAMEEFAANSGLWSGDRNFSSDSDSSWGTAAIFTTTAASLFKPSVGGEKMYLGITSVDLSNYNQSTIPPYMFMGLNKLSEVAIPSGVRVIDTGAFFECNSLTDVYCYADTVSVAGAGTTGDSSLGWTSATYPSFSHWAWDAIAGDFTVQSLEGLNLYGLAYSNNELIAYAEENNCNFIPFVVLDDYDTKPLFGFDVTGYNNVEIADMVYTGKALTPEVRVTFTDVNGVDDRVLENGNGCTIVYKDANGNTVSEIVGAGIYTAQITGDNKSVFGTKTIQFEVVDPAAAQEGQQQGTQQQGGQQQGTQQNTQQQGTQQQGVQQQGGVVYPAGYTQQQATSSMAQTGDGTDVAPLAVASLAALGVAAASAAVVSRKRSVKSADEHDAR